MAKPIHVMVVSFGAQGHLNPTLQFLARLAAKGLCATLATTHSAHQRILRAQTDHPTATTKHHLVQIEPFSDGMDYDNDLPIDLNFYMEQLGTVGPKSLTELILRLADEGRPVSCLINNPILPWVLDVGTQLHIPCGALWIQSCAMYALYYRHCCKLTRFTGIGSEPDLVVPGLPPLKLEDLPSLVLLDNPYPVFLDLVTEQFEKMKSIKWVFANSVKELEFDAIESMGEILPIKPVGPLVPSSLLGPIDGPDVRVDMWEAAQECLKWLDNQPEKSVIYISLGSLATLHADQMAELAWGLKNSAARFLWVAKSRLGESDPGFPVGLLVEASDLGRVVSWSPQTDVLKHPAVAGFLTHCGWNSMLETLCAGVPVIALPLWTDQPTNAKFLVDVYRVGVRLQAGPNGIVPRDEVQRCIDELLGGERAAEMRQNAVKWKDVVRMAGLEGGSSDCIIQEFVDELVSLSSQSEPP